MRRLIFLIAVYSSLFHSPALHAADADAEGDAIVRRMYAARQQLKSGVVRIRGVRDSFNPERSPQSYQWPVHADLAFDWRAGHLRYDAKTVEETGFVSLNELAEAEDLSSLVEDTPTEQVTNWMRSILTPDIYAYYLKITSDNPEPRVIADNGIELFDADTDAPVPVVNSHYCFDVRSVGLFNFWEFRAQTHVMGYELPDVYCHLCDLDIALERLLEWPIVGIERDEDLTTLRFNGDMTITLNESQGYTPVAYFHTRGTPHPDYITDTVTSSVHWTQIDDVWVPTRFMIELLDAKCDGSALRHTYTLDWSLVNQPIPESYFDWKNFTDIEEQSYVMDNRGDYAIQIGEWRNSEFVAFELPDTTAPATLAKPSERKWSTLLMLNTAVVVLLLGGTLVWRLFRRQPV